MHSAEDGGRPLGGRRRRGPEGEFACALLEGAVGHTQMEGVTVMDLTAMAKHTAWIRRLRDGTYEVAPLDTVNPEAAGYIKSSMLVPEGGAQRTIFPEMNQQ